MCKRSQCTFSKIPEEGWFGCRNIIRCIYIVSALAFTTHYNLSIVRLCRYFKFGKLTFCFLYKERQRNVSKRKTHVQGVEIVQKTLSVLIIYADCISLLSPSSLLLTHQAERKIKR